MKKSKIREVDIRDLPYDHEASIKLKKDVEELMKSLYKDSYDKDGCYIGRGLGLYKLCERIVLLEDKLERLIGVDYGNK